MPSDADESSTVPLDHLSFVDHAIDHTSSRIDGLDPQAMRLVLTLHRVTSALIYDLEASVHRPRGWSWSGFRLLFVLWVAGPLEATRAAELSGMSRAAVSSLVNTLERDGLVSRTQDEQDRRAVTLTLTNTGAEAMGEAFGEHNTRERAWTATLSTPERTLLIGLLEKLATGTTDIRRRK